MDPIDLRHLEPLGYQIKRPTFLRWPFCSFKFCLQVLNLIDPSLGYFLTFLQHLGLDFYFKRLVDVRKVHDEPPMHICDLLL